MTYGSGAAGSYYGYDELGRVLRRAQKFDGNTTDYTVTAAYNRVGAMTGETYPSGNAVSYGYDTASRLTSFSGNLSGTQTTYATVTQFNPASQIERETYGMTTPLYLKQAYNKRLQLVDTRLGTVNDATSWDRGRLSLVYGTATFNLSNTRDSANTELTITDLQGNNTDNNGNVRRMYSFLPNGTIPQRDDYTYDPLNRLSTMTECQRQAAGGTMVANIANQTYAYDRWGNNTITGTNPSGLTFNAANNRINMAGYSYDSAGNLITQNNQARTYDAENRMVSAASTGFYTYDGEGKRVKRTASGTTYCYVYGIGGELLAEYMGTSTPTLSKQYGYKGGQLLVTAEGATLKWLVQDHLGSTRMELNSSGAVDKRHDYLPFGEELLVGTVRSGGANAYEPPVSNTRQRFGTYERDNETGLDFAQARYFSNVQGRFTSPDPLLSSGSIYKPQSWNRYSYSANNPLRYVDPTGLFLWDTSLGGTASDEELLKRKGGQKIVDQRNAFRNALGDAAMAMLSDKIDDGQRQGIGDALNAYGAEGDDNGVSVAIGKPKSKTASAETDVNSAVNQGAFLDASGAKANIKITFRNVEAMNAKTVVHEGSHSFDRQTLAFIMLHGRADSWQHPGYNVTKYETEFRAYQMGAAVARAMGESSLVYGGNEIWNSGWKGADRITLMNRGIKEYLKDKDGYNVTSENPGNVMLRFGK